jgi:hypothetical protein
MPLRSSPVCRLDLRHASGGEALGFAAMAAAERMLFMPCSVLFVSFGGQCLARSYVPLGR